MKKYIYYAGIVAAGLSSCSSEDVVEIAPGDPITFRTSMALNEATRGTEITASNMQQFKVTALEDAAGQGATLFDQLIFRKGDNAEFKSTEEYLWHEGANLTFYACSFLTQDGKDITDAMMGDKAEFYVTNDQKTINNIKPKKNIKDHLDIVVAKETATYEANRHQAVNLTFHHILSQLVVKAKSENDTYDFYVKGIKFCNILDRGDWNWEENSVSIPHEKGGGWTLNGANKVNYDPIYYTHIKLNSTAQDITNVEDAGYPGYPMVVPQQLNSSNISYNTGWGQYIAVLLQIRTKDTNLQVFPVGHEGKYAWACIPLFNEKANIWKPGHRITYILDFTWGAGYTNPDPDPTTDPDPDNPIVEPDPTDPPKPILDGLIKFTVSVSEWTADDPIYPPLIGPNTK